MARGLELAFSKIATLESQLAAVAIPDLSSVHVKIDTLATELGALKNNAEFHVQTIMQRVHDRCVETENEVHQKLIGIAQTNSAPTGPKMSQAQGFGPAHELAPKGPDAPEQQEAPKEPERHDYFAEALGMSAPEEQEPHPIQAIVE